MKIGKWTGLLILLLVLLLAGCRQGKPDSDTSVEEGTTRTFEEDGQVDEITLEGMATDILETMSLEEKIGQLFIVCTDSLDFSAETKMTEEMRKNLQLYQPGGIIFFSFNIDEPEQTKTFIRDMQDSVKIPMFMGVDEEGGLVARIANNEKMGTTSFPTMKEVGETGSLEMALEMGRTIGKEMSELGFNLDFAPVADVMSNEANTEIGKRSFGSDPELVADMVDEVVKGLQENDVCATLKHFPGQGSSGDDTHRGYVGMDVTIDDLRESDFLPFKRGIRTGADFVMVSHVSVNEVTGNDVPSSLSPVVVRDILRDELQFEKVIVTDAMNMKSITKFYDSDEAARLAFKAGNDMILMPDDFMLALEGITEAVNEGNISEEELDEAVMRILKVKILRGIIPEDSEYFTR